MKQQELKPASINYALNNLRAFYQWLRRSNGYPVNQPLPTDAVGTDEPMRIREPFEANRLKRYRAIVALLSHGGHLNYPCLMSITGTAKD